MAISQEVIFDPSETYPEQVVNPNFASNLEDLNVTPAVCAEVARLQEHGLDVQLVDVPDDQALDAEEQERFDREAARLEADPKNGHEEFSSTPAMKAWVGLRKSAIALHPLYRSVDNVALGDGIDPGAYDIPLFPAAGDDPRLLSAKQALVHNAADPSVAGTKIAAYDNFLGTTIDDESRFIFQGSLDGRAIRTRKGIAIDIATRHFAKKGTLQGQTLSSASLGCGAADPVYALVDQFESRGATFEKVTLVDSDPMALATAHSLARGTAAEGKIDVKNKDLFAEPLTNYIHEQVDVVDLLGLFEYVPDSDNERIGHQATALLERVGKIVKPGGVIIFGNMVDDRRQQTYLKEVARWPRLQQRSVEETLKIIDAAGFDVSQVQVRIPAREGVYAVYAIPISDSEPSDDGNPYEHYPRLVA